MYHVRCHFWFLTLYLSGHVLADLSDCPLLPEPENGYYEEVSNTKIKAICNPGYYLVGKPFTRCVDGKWTSPGANCYKAENECSGPPKLENGKLLASGNKIGTTIIYECNEGYFMIGENKRTCTRQKYWSGVPPYCHPKDRKPEEIVGLLKHHLDTNITALKSTAAHGRILGPEIYEVGLELFFLLDRSSSVDPIDFQSSKKFVIKLVKVFKGNENREKGTRVHVISFGSEVKVEVDIKNASFNSVNATVKRIELIQGEGGGTAMQPAFQKVFESFPVWRPKAKKALFLLTDGEPNIYNGVGVEPEDEARNLKDMGFEIYCIGVGKDIGSERLIKIASDPPINHVFMLEKYNKLEEVLDYIQKPLPTTTPPPPPGPDACGYLGDSKDEAKYETKSKPYPWLAAVYVFPMNRGKYEQVRFCSGVVISEQWILTSGLCVQEHVQNKLEQPQTTVVLRTRDLKSKGLNFYSTNFTLSPLNDPNLLPEVRLALIKLDRKIPMDDGKIRPVCLPNPDAFDLIFYQNDATPMTSIEGWGSMANHKADHKLALRAAYVSPTSRRIKVDKFNLENDCKSFLNRKYQTHDFDVNKVADKTFCVGNREERLKHSRRKPSVCSGNFGSPLVTKDAKTKRYTLLGIQSSVFGCSDVKSHFLQVKHYFSWIERTVGGINHL